ncbi:MAG: hypothetical protein ACJA1N_000734 [Saprospiraceae bacterium]|jgi:hypothetical protein
MNASFGRLTISVAVAFSRIESIKTVTAAKGSYGNCNLSEFVKDYQRTTLFYYLQSNNK